MRFSPLNVSTSQVSGSSTTRCHWVHLGAINAPRVLGALRAIVASAERRGQAVFTIVLPPTSIDAARALAEEGVRLTFGNETTQVQAAFRRFADEANRGLR